MDPVLDISAVNIADSAVDLVASPSGTPSNTLATLGADSGLGFDIRNGSDADRSCTTFGTFGPKDGHEALPGDPPHVHPSPSQPGIATSSETGVSPPTVRLSFNCK